MITSKELDFLIQAANGFKSDSPNKQFLTNNDKFKYLYENLGNLRVEMQENYQITKES
jgi:hypothetical protein